MLLQPARIVRVTSEQEFDSALGSADQVIVEGDDKLLSYAVSKASNDPQNRIAIEVGDRSIAVGREDDPDERPERVPSPVAPASHAPEEIVAPVRSHALAIVAGVLLLAVLAALGAYLGLRTQSPSDSSAPSTIIAPDQPSIAPTPEPAPQVEPPGPIPPDQPRIPIPEPAPQVERPGPIPPVESPGYTSAPNPGRSNLPPGISGVLQTLVWPLVAIVAIVALFLVARQAIAGGRNVEISWKVTEKVSGRVVITKVRKRAGKQRAAA
jgi:hypothetical protein